VVFIEWCNPPGRCPPWRLNFNDLSAEVAKDLAAEQTPLGCQVKDSIGAQHRLPPSEKKDKWRNRAREKFLSFLYLQA
jgi:hypothetical protein